MQAALSLRDLHKRYRGIAALDGLNMSVPAGSICGFVGPNGAGKTTTFGIVAGLLQAHAGEVDILGSGPFHYSRHRGRVTLLPQDSEMSPHMPVRALLFHYGRLQGLSQRQAVEQAEAKLDAVALNERADARIKELSHGMRRRLQVAQALLGDPQLVLLDEPTSGLDPQLVVRMRQLFAAQRGHRTLLISSHNLMELEAVCDHVVFIEKGRCVREGTLAQVTQRGALVRYTLGQPVDTATLSAALPAQTQLSWTGSTLLVQAPEGWQTARLNATVIPLLIAGGAELLEVRQGQSLEQAYLSPRQ